MLEITSVEFEAIDDAIRALREIRDETPRRQFYTVGFLTAGYLAKRLASMRTRIERLCRGNNVDLWNPKNDLSSGSQSTIPGPTKPNIVSDVSAEPIKTEQKKPIPIGGRFVDRRTSP